ncbi:MAG: hypothetical protein VXX63_01915 [Bacteroidota bacterium]|nr:hypothetical protein [Bacteroidota bacterium]
MKYWLIIIPVFVYTNLNAQPKKIPPKLGVKMGANLSTIFGGMLVNQRPRAGIQTGLYMKDQRKKTFRNFAEIEMAFTGSNFRNQTGEYRKMNFLMINASFCKFKKIGNKNELLLGIQNAYILQSELYVNGEVKAKYRDMAFSKFDPQIKVGFSQNKEIASLLWELRFSILNIGKPLNLTELSPSLNKKGKIKNFSLGASFLF